jgi:IS30 family transposase
MLSFFTTKKEKQMRYKQLTLKKRYNIMALLKQGFNQKDIAKIIDVNPSTISRELGRNNVRYNPEKAEIRAKIKHINKPKIVPVVTTKIEKYIREKLKLQWSPEQISGRLYKKLKLSISHESIYKFIYKNKSNGGNLYKSLRHRNKKYNNRLNKYQKRGMIKDRISIDDRRNVVDDKSRIGDWEIDTVIGKNHKGVLVTIVDKASKFTLIKKVSSKHAEVVTKATIELLSPIKHLTRTITSDNGKEFAYHKQISQALNTSFYFCDPYSSWQRGLNEHTNGLIRQYIPKKSRFDNITQEEIANIQDRLNHRPRKSLNFKTPYEVFMLEVVKKLVA